MQKSIREKIEQHAILCLRSAYNKASPPELIIRESLFGADFSNLNLSGIVLVDIDLQSVNFSGTDLRGACLSRLNLSGANFEGANLSNCNLNRTNLQNTNFTNATLSYADLTGSDTVGACFDNADMSFIYNEKNPKSHRVNLPIKKSFNSHLPIKTPYGTAIATYIIEQEQVEHIAVFPFPVPPMEEAWDKIGKNLMTGLMAGLKPLKPIMYE